METEVKNQYITDEAKAWLRFNDGTTAVVRIIPKQDHLKSAQCYAIYPAYVLNPDCLGRILFDSKGFWIYDGELLQVDEQEQLAQFIKTYVERI